MNPPNFIKKLSLIESSLAGKEGRRPPSKNGSYTYYDQQTKNLKGLPAFFKIGNLIHQGGLTYPALIPFKGLTGIGFELNETNREEIHLTIQHIALQFLKYLDPSVCKITIIDPKKIGGNFRYLRKIGTPILDELIFSSDKIKKNIEGQLDTSVGIVNECLVDFCKLEDYNKHATEPEPYRFVFIADFPHGFRESLEKLETLLHNNEEGGMFFFFTYDKDIDLGSYRDKSQRILDQLILLREFDDPANDYYKVSNFKHQALFNDEFTLQLDRKAINPSNLEKLLKQLLKNQPIEEDFGEGIRIPIGKVRGRTHYFTLGYNTGNINAIIGGQPGNGKTVLLNNIIARGIESYDKEELKYVLIDCAGTGFQEYMGHPSIEAQCSSSDVEACKLVIEKLEQTLKEREVLFKKHKVADIWQYRKKTKKILPYLLCVIDEFHVLFTGSRKTSTYIETILVDHVIRIGRKFGLHLVLCTQSLDGGVRQSILNNISLRIALGMTKGQSSKFLDMKNEAAGNLPIGTAIYNDRNGEIKANKKVKINFIKPEGVEQILNKSKQMV